MPPPGFGPKIDKRKVEAEAAQVPASERYSIRVERQDDEMLRHVLAAAQHHAGPSPQRLMRDQRRLHHMYTHLTRLGFSQESVE